MKKGLIGTLLVGLAVAAIGLGSMASSGTAAGPSQYQYRKPGLALTTQVVNSQIYFNIAGTGYNSGAPASGEIAFTCARRASNCPSPTPWGPVLPDTAGSFSFLAAIDDCGPVRSAVAQDANGVKSNSVKAGC